MSAVNALTDRRRNLIFINVVLSCCAASILQTALNTALATISQDLNISSTTAQWLVSAYSLAMGIVMPLTAFLIRRIKTKRLYLFGLLLFVIGLTIDIFAPNFALLLIGRILQGCGNGILISMTQVVILSIFPPSRQGTAMGWYGLAVTAMPAVAPTLGGILVEAINWRAIFVLALAVLVVALFMALKVFDNVLETSKINLDMASFFLSILGFGGLTLGIGNLASYGFANPSVYIALIVGAVAMIFFILRQLRSKEPFLDFKILKTGAVAIGLIGTMILYFVMMGSSVLMPLYVQNVKGGSAIIAGLVTLPGSIVMAVVNPLSGRIYDRVGIKRLFILGSALLAISSFLMFILRASQPLGFAIAYSIFRYLAIGLMMMPLITWATTNAGRKRMADASAMLSSLRTISGAVGTAVFVGISSSVAVRVAGGSDPDATQLMHGMNVAFLVMGFCSVAMLFVAIFFVKEHRDQKAEAAKAPEEKLEEEVLEKVEGSETVKEIEDAGKVPAPEIMEELEAQAEEETAGEAEKENQDKP